MCLNLLVEWIDSFNVQIDIGIIFFIFKFCLINGVMFILYRFVKNVENYWLQSGMKFVLNLVGKVMEIFNCIFYRMQKNGDV